MFEMASSFVEVEFLFLQRSHTTVMRLQFGVVDCAVLIQCTVMFSEPCKCSFTFNGFLNPILSTATANGVSSRTTTRHYSSSLRKRTRVIESLGVKPNQTLNRVRGAGRVIYEARVPVVGQLSRFL